MRRFAPVATLVVVLSAASAFAQAPAAQTPAPAPAPAPAAQAPAAPAAVPAPVPPAPFPVGAKIAFVDFQRVASESVEGQNSTGKINALVAKKQAEGAEKAKALQANQQKLQQSGGVMSDAARLQLERDIERQTKEGERFQQDAQAEINELQQELQVEFQKKISPLVQQLGQEKGIQILFSRMDAGIVWWDPGIDLSSELIKKLDAITPRSTAAPAAAPARPAAAPAPRPAAPAAPRPAAPTVPPVPRP
jgi:Skp family chaperone for outer membrane proteins